MEEPGIEKTITGQVLQRYKKELSEELDTILAYWINNTVDKEQGGFYGSVDTADIPDRAAPKGIVLNSRILWTFSAAFGVTRKAQHLQIAERAFQYMLDHFTDPVHGGMYWSVDHKGEMLDGKKQVYGLAFGIYGMTEYYKVSADPVALQVAQDLFALIEQHSHDKEKGGYIEAFTREWQPAEDLRLSEKDDNERKTMNTHLHIVEAYANMYQVWPDKNLYDKIGSLLDIFGSYFINKENFHLNLFMDDDWNIKSGLQSFGHDIEAAWLLQECAEVIGDKAAINNFKEYALLMADAAAEGLAKDGGLWYEFDAATDHWIWEKHSWPQAEGMVGFFNAYQLTGAEKYLQYSTGCWDFVKKHLRDNAGGEWYWGVDETYSIMQKDKAGFWKCPYHSGRACMELMRRIGLIQNSKGKIQK